MPLYECYMRGSELIEADTPDDARLEYVQLIITEPDERFIAVNEIVSNEIVSDEVD